MGRSHGPRPPTRDSTPLRGRADNVDNDFDFNFDFDQLLESSVHQDECRHPRYGRSFPQRRHEKQHYAAMHDKSIPRYRCEGCGRQFNNPSSRKRHLRSPTACRGAAAPELRMAAAMAAAPAAQDGASSPKPANVDPPLRRALPDDIDFPLWVSPAFGDAAADVDFDQLFHPSANEAVAANVGPNSRPRPRTRTELPISEFPGVQQDVRSRGTRETALPSETRPHGNECARKDRSHPFNDKSALPDTETNTARAKHSSTRALRGNINNSGITINKQLRLIKRSPRLEATSADGVHQSDQVYEAGGSSGWESYIENMYIHT